MSLPFARVDLGADGRLRDPSAHAAQDLILDRNATDVFIVAFDTRQGAQRSLAEDLRGSIERGLIADGAAGHRTVMVEASWPSLDWMWEPAQGHVASDADDLREQIAAQILEPDRRASLQRLAGELPTSHEARREFVELARRGLRPSKRSDPDRTPRFLTELSPDELLESLAPTEARDDPGGLWSDPLGDEPLVFEPEYAAAGNLLGLVAYSTAKQRAGHAGGRGMAALLDGIHATAPGARIHIVGHSLGAYAAAVAVMQSESPIHSVSLVQGTMSSYSFARDYDGAGANGPFVKLPQRVDGPVLITYALSDKRAGYVHRLASRLGRQLGGALGDDNSWDLSLANYGAIKTPETRVTEITDRGALIGGAKVQMVPVDGFIASHDDVGARAVAEAVLSAAFSPTSPGPSVPAWSVPLSPRIPDPGDPWPGDPWPGDLGPEIVEPQSAEPERSAAGDGAAAQSGAGTDPSGSPAGRKRTAYPLLRPAHVDPDVDFSIQTGTSFELDIGIAPSLDPRLAASGGLGEVVEEVPITIHLAYDPGSFTVTGDRPIVVTPTKDEPFPFATVSVTPEPLGERQRENRRIAAHYFIDGSLRGIAVRTFREAGTPAPTTATAPARIDLGPLAGAAAPDVVVAIYRADVVTPGTYFVAVFPRELDGSLPPVERVTIDETAAVHVDQLYAAAEGDVDPRARYLTLRGRARRLGERIPSTVRRALKRIAEAAPKAHPATMLLLTDDALIPWELALFPDGDRITSAAGGDSPFLGAHFAIGRWPLGAETERARRPDPDAVEVRLTALVTADYKDEVGGWEPLRGAIKEVAALKKSYTPATVWQPLRAELLKNLSTDVDVVHFAMHGSYDLDEVEDGLVLIEKGMRGASVAYLGAGMLEGRIDESPPLFPRRPFVFLNACQLGRTKKALGNYGGLAGVMLQAGARAVVACLWNIDDGVAGSISREFYALADEGVPPAEIIRRVRARYIVPDGMPADKAPSATLIAYQYYGHPSMRVIRQK